MKSIFICFLTERNQKDAINLIGTHLNDFIILNENACIDALENPVLAPGRYYLYISSLINERLKSSINAKALEPDAGPLKILLNDFASNSSIINDSAGLFDMVVNVNNDFQSSSQIIGQLIKNSTLQVDIVEHERKYSTLVNNLPGITFRCKNDSDWTMLFLSQKMEKLCGYPARNFINNKNLTYSDIIVPQDRENVWLAIQKAVKKRVPYKIEYRIRTVSGRVKWVWEQGRVISLESGEDILEGVIMDIDDQKNLEKRIELMREMVIALDKSSDVTDLIEIIKQELAKVILAEEFSLSLFSWEKREFLIPFVEDGREYYKRVPMTKSLDALVIKRNRTIFLKRKEIRKLEGQGKVSLDGKIPEVWLGIPLVMHGKASGVIVLQDFKNEFAIDTIDIELLEFVSVQLVASILKKQAEDESRKLLKALEQSPVSVMITDLDGNIVYANNKAAELSGYSISDMMGKIPNIIEPYNSDPDHYKGIWKALKEEGKWEGEFENTTKTGNHYWEYARLASIINSRGKSTHYVYMKEEITDRKNMMMELNKAKTRAEESDKLKTAFLANMSHEIRTPMNAILGFSDMLRLGDYVEEDHDEFLNLIVENSKILLKTIDDIIDIAKIEAGEMTISTSRCSANKILYDNFYAFDKIRAKLGKTQIEFIYRQYEEDRNFFFNSDPVRINQVLGNILENAFKYTTEGVIELGYTLFTEDKIEYLDFYVKDSGQGIQSNNKEVIFNRFSQASDSYMNTTGGTGLGLSISRNIARLMHGDIRLESKLGEGSVFHFLIPHIPFQQKEYIPTDTPNFKEKKELDWPDKTVLIAEDEDSNFKLLEIMLRKTNVKIERSYNGKQAVDYVIGGNDVDLILMDVRMPIMNGYDATEHIKKFSSRLPVIIQTAFAFSGDRENSFEAGCDAYLSKPIIANDLYRLMKKFLD